MKLLFHFTLGLVILSIFCGKDGMGGAPSSQNKAEKSGLASYLWSYFDYGKKKVDIDDELTEPLAARTRSKLKSDLLLSPQISEFLNLVDTTHMLTSKLPFSNFGEACSNLISLVKKLIHHQSYDLRMDEYLGPLVDSFKEIVNTYGISVVQKKNKYFLTYNFLAKPFEDFKAELTNLIYKKSSFTRNKDLSGYISSFYTTANQVSAAIDLIYFNRPIYTETSRFYFEAAEKPQSVNQLNNHAQSMIHTLFKLGDIIDGRYKYKTPITKMTIYFDFVVVFSSLYDLLIKTADYNYILTADTLLTSFLNLQTNMTLKKSRFNENQQIIFLTQSKIKLTSDLRTTKIFVKENCPGKDLEPYCLTLIDHIKRLIKTIQNKLINIDDIESKDFLFKSNHQMIPFEQQTLAEERRAVISLIDSSLKNIDSPYFRNYHSKLSVHIKSAASSIIKIFKAYQQPDALIDKLAEFNDLVTSMVENSKIKQRKNRNKVEVGFYLYPKSICVDLILFLIDFRTSFMDQIIFDKNDSIAIMEFYVANVNLYEAWSMFKGDIGMSVRNCSEEFLDNQELHSDNNYFSVNEIEDENNRDTSKVSEDKDDGFGEFVSAPFDEIQQPVNAKEIPLSMPDYSTHDNQEKEALRFKNLIPENYHQAPQVYNNYKTNIGQLISEHEKDIGPSYEEDNVLGQMENLNNSFSIEDVPSASHRHSIVSSSSDDGFDEGTTQVNTVVTESGVPLKSSENKPALIQIEDTDPEFSVKTPTENLGLSKINLLETSQKRVKVVKRKIILVELMLCSYCVNDKNFLSYVQQQNILKH